MFFRRVPFLSKFFQARDKQQHRRSLVQIVLPALLITSLFPVLLIGTLNTYRSRTLLRDQVSTQMESVVTNNLLRVREYIRTREQMMDRLASDPLFQRNLATLVNSPSDSEEYGRARSTIFVTMTIFFDYRTWAQTGSSNFFDEMLILRSDGQLLVESSTNYTLQNFGKTKIDHPFILSLIGTNGSVIANNATNISPNQMVVYSTRSFVNDKGETTATMIALGSNSTMIRTLVDTQSFFPKSRAYYFTSDMKLLGPSVQPGVNNTTIYSAQELLPEPAMNDPLTALVQNKGDEALFSAKKQSNENAYLYAHWMPEYQMGVALELPEDTIYGENFLDPVNVIALLISLVIISGVVYYGTTGVINPLVHLSKVAERFSKGNWAERARINRKDEIGLLSNSFDHMADELSELYQSLETVVEKRTSQLRIASEVAQLATSTTKLEETLSRTVHLVAERFGYYHVALYLVDETGRSMVLSEAGGVGADVIKQRNEHIEIVPNSLMGWVATNNKSRVITNVHQDEVFRPNSLLPDTLSEVGIPISVGDEVLGVMDIQSTLADAFDQETVAVLQTLANQISSSLYNIRLLATTQMSYQETNLLYRTTRQVTQANNEAEILQILTDAFAQLPYVALILSVQDDQFKVMVVTDSKTGRVDRNLVNITIPIRGMGELLLQDRVQLIDIGKPSDFDNILSFLFRRGCKTAALLSVVDNGKLSKVLALGSREADMITMNTLQPYANLSEVISASLEKFHILTTLEQRVSELQNLTSFSQAITIEPDVQNLFKALHQQVLQTIGADISFAVCLYNSRKNLIEVPYRYEKDKQSDAVAPFPLGEGLTSHVINSRKPLLLNKNAMEKAQELGAKVVGNPAKSWMGIPLVFANEVVGALIIQDTEHEERFTQNDLTLFVALAPQIATAIRNAQLLKETQDALGAYHLEHFLLNSMLSNIPDTMSFKDREGKYVRASKTMGDIFHHDVEDLVGKTDFDLMDSAMAEMMWEKQKNVLETGRPETEIMMQTSIETGQPSWLQFTTIPIFDMDDSPYGLLIITRDITEVKRAEALAERRSEQVLTASEIARETSGTLEVDTLLQKSVNLVRDRFGFYHASIFTVDNANEYAKLRESTGTAGQQMMQAGHRLAIGSKSIVGRVTAQGKALVVNDVTLDPDYYPNPLLPETRSELAMPLKVGERILGALDVQSRQINAFREEDVNVLQILADQLAVAIVNAELFAKTQELLSKHRLLRQITIVASASTTLEDALVNVVKSLHSARVGERISVLLMNAEGFLQIQASAGYEGTRHLEMRVRPGEGITGLAAAEKRPIRIDNTQADPRYINDDPDVHSELAIPILFSEQVTGVLNLESTRIAAFDENDQEILGALGNNLGGVIANIRLVQQVRQQVERERLLFDITSKIRRSVDLETILQTSTQEIARALGAKRAKIEITAGSALYRETAADTTIHMDVLDGENRKPLNGSSHNGQEKKA